MTGDLDINPSRGYICYLWHPQYYTEYSWCWGGGSSLVELCPTGPGSVEGWHSFYQKLNFKNNVIVLDTFVYCMSAFQCLLAVASGYYNPSAWLVECWICMSEDVGSNPSRGKIFFSVNSSFRISCIINSFLVYIFGIKYNWQYSKNKLNQEMFQLLL